MISLPLGTRIVKFYDSEMKKVGKGTLYLLSNGLLFEKRGEGARFECNFDYLASFEAVKKDRLVAVIRTPQGRRSVEFKVEDAKKAEDEISQTNIRYASSSESTNLQGNEKLAFDQDAHSRSEARWFEQNWDKIMGFVKPERASYLGDFVKNVKIESPNVDPYLLVVDHENLDYKDFADLPGFLKWRYPGMTDKEAEMTAGVFRDFEEFSVRTLEMQIQRASKSKNYIKHSRSLYEHVAINSREIAEELKTKNIRE